MSSSEDEEEPSPRYIPVSVDSSDEGEEDIDFLVHCTVQQMYRQTDTNYFAVMPKDVIEVILREYVKMFYPTEYMSSQWRAHWTVTEKDSRV